TGVERRHEGLDALYHALLDEFLTHGVAVVTRLDLDPYLDVGLLTRLVVRCAEELLDLADAPVDADTEAGEQHHRDEERPERAAATLALPPPSLPLLARGRPPAAASGLLVLPGQVQIVKH